jgi:putative ATP-dependent endonuclease of OLD family
MQHKRLPEDDGIDIVVVRGIGFRVYLDIAKALKHPVRVVKDNDGDHQKNIVDWKSDGYGSCDFIECMSPTDNAQNSLEPALVAANSGTEDALDKLAKILLTPPTFKKFQECDGTAAKQSFLKEWYSGNSGSKKVDSAMRLFETAETILYPDYLLKAVLF